MGLLWRFGSIWRVQLTDKAASFEKSYASCSPKRPSIVVFGIMRVISVHLPTTRSLRIHWTVPGKHLHPSIMKHGDTVDGKFAMICPGKYVILLKVLSVCAPEVGTIF